MSFVQADSRTQLIFNLDLAAESWTIEVDAYNAFLRRMTTAWADTALPQQIDHDRFLADIKEFVDATCGAVGEERFVKARYALFYLLTGALLASRCEQLGYGFQVDLESGLTMGAGLGSSASFGVCLATTFHFYAK